MASLLGAGSGQTPAASAQTADAVTLTLLHNNDGESSLVSLTNAVAVGETTLPVPVGGVAAYRAVVDRESAEARARGHAVLTVFAGDAYLPGPTSVCSEVEGNPSYDALAQHAIPYDAHIIGNHEFDSGPDAFERFIRAFDGRPFLSANLDFSGEPGYADLVDGDGLIELPIEDGRVIGRSMVVTDAATSARFGIVGATTPLLPVVSAPRDVTVTADLAATAMAVQAEIDRLLGEGVQRIILVSHLQGLASDVELVALLRGVDIAVAGGGDELLLSPHVDAALQRLPGERTETEGEYPRRATDADGRTVYLVTTAGNYQYVGRLDVTFDAVGEVTGVAAETSYPRPVVPSSEEASAAGFPATVERDAGLVEAVERPVRDCLSGLATTRVGATEILLDVSRTAARTRETNAGNLVADAFLRSYDRHADDFGLPPRGADHPVVAIQNGGGIRQNAGDLLPTNGTALGDIYLLNTLDVLPFADAVSVIPGVTAAQLRAAFEVSISRYPDASGAFLQVGGIEVTYDAARPPGSRVVELTLADGTPLVAGGVIVGGAPSVTVLTGSFIAGGGDGYTMFEDIAGKLQLPTTYERSLRDSLRALGTVSADDPRYAPGGEGRITFVEPSAATAAPGPATDADQATEEGPAQPETGTAGLLRTDKAPSPLAMLVLALTAIAGVAAARRATRQRGSP